MLCWLQCIAAHTAFYRLKAVALFKIKCNVYVVTIKPEFLLKINGWKKTCLQLILHLDKPRLDSYDIKSLIFNIELKAARYAVCLSRWYLFPLGRQFYSCARREGGCGFFLWADQGNPASHGFSTSSGPPPHLRQAPMNNHSTSTCMLFHTTVCTCMYNVP